MCPLVTVYYSVTKVTPPDPILRLHHLLSLSTAQPLYLRKRSRLALSLIEYRRISPEPGSSNDRYFVLRHVTPWSRDPEVT